MPLKYPKDYNKEIRYCGSMNSYEDSLIIGENQFELLVNVYHDGSKLRKRPPHKRIHWSDPASGTKTGVWMPKGMGVYRTAAATYVVWATAQGKLWRTLSDGTSLAEITLASANALTAGNFCDLCQYFGDFYAADQVKFLELNVTAATAANLTAGLSAPSATGITAPYKMAYYQFRLALCDRTGRTALTQQEADISVDADPWKFTGAGATGFINPIASGDGKQISGIAVNNTTLVFNKMSSQPEEYLGGTFKMTGSSQDDFAVKEISSILGYLGTSGQSIGSRLFGLTHSGFQYLNTVESLGTDTSSGAVNSEKVVSAFQQNVIPEFIKDKLKLLNINFAEQVAGIYSPREHAYYCSFPYQVSEWNNLTVRIDFTNNDIRMSFFTNTDAQYFCYMNGFVHFIDRKGTIWRMMDHDQTTYEEEEFTTIIMSKKFAMNDTREYGNIRSFVPEIQIEGANKTLKLFYHTFTTDTATRVVNRSTDRKGISATVGDYKLIKELSFYPNRWDNLIFDMDNYDYQHFDTFHPELQVNVNCDYSQFLLIDQCQDTDGTKGWNFMGYKVKGSSAGESL